MVAGHNPKPPKSLPHKTERVPQCWRISQCMINNEGEVTWYQVHQWMIAGEGGVMHAGAGNEQ